MKAQDSPHLSRYFARLERGQPWRWQGRVLESVGQTIESAGPPASVGECCEILDQFGGQHLAEVIGFRGSNVLSMPVGSTEGIRFGNPVAALGVSPELEVGPALMGRVLNALGEPIDEGRPPVTSMTLPLDGAVRSPMDRVPIRTPLGTGIRVLDALLTVGRGQRVGIFGGSGVGKSTLIGMMTRNTEADVTVVGLVGERGREVGEFLEDSLGVEGRARSVVVVSTSDQSPLMRMRAALAATTAAEYFASQGKHVLLVLDSLTRFAMAAREIGLAAGEPPTNKGYTPSVFTRLARLVERTGQFRVGSITAFYTVLMEGDDQQDPLVDAVRALLDGHVVLSRSLAAEGWYPPIEVLDSISRLMPAVAGPEHREQAALLRRLMAVYARSEDLVRIGAYKPGADPDLDRALRAREAMRTFMTQDSSEQVCLSDALRRLAELATEVWRMAVSRALRRLLRIRELEEEQRRLALESAAAQLNRMRSALAANVERDRKGRALVVESARSGELPDRLAGVVETHLALRFEKVLTPRIASVELEAAGLRQEYLAKRVERRQAETLIRETEAQEEVEGGRRAQQSLDDWFGNRAPREPRERRPA